MFRYSFCFSCLLFTLILHQLSSNPITIGILTLFIKKLEPLIEKNFQIDKQAQQFKLKEMLKNGSYISETYINWLQSVNLTILPIDINLKDEELLLEIEKCDGLLLTGGREVFYDQEQQHNKSEKIPAEYLKKIEKIIQRVKEINDFKRNYPVWGTCLGFEAILITDSKYTVMRHDVNNHIKAPAPIKILENKSRSNHFFSKSEFKTMEKMNITYFNHKYGLFVDEILNNENLKDSVDAIGVFEKDGHSLLVWYEYKNYPIIGVQFHPEKFTKLNDSKQDTLPFFQYNINRKFARLLKSFIEKPVIYMKDFWIETMPKLKNSDEKLGDLQTIFKDKSVMDENEDHFTLEKVGMYEKIEVFVRKGDESEY